MAGIHLTLDDSPNDIVETYQAFINLRERKNKPIITKAQVINRIIREWGEDRSLVLEVAKKRK